MKKRLISMLLVLSFVLSMIPLSITATAQTEKAEAQTADEFAVLSGNASVVKDESGNFVVKRTNSNETVVAKKNGDGYDTLEEGWIKLDIPVGSAYNIRKRQGIVFGAEDMANLNKGTHYFAYIDGANETNPHVVLAKVTDGVVTPFHNYWNEYTLNGVLSAREIWDMDSIELSVYFTKDGVIKTYIEGFCVFQTTGQTITGSQYGLKITGTEKLTSGMPNGTAANANSGNFAFKSLTTKGFDDYRLVYGGWDMGANGITSALNFNDEAIDDRSFWIANDTVESDKTVFRFSIKDYKNAVPGTSSATDTNSGIVFGAVVPEGADFYNGDSKTNEDTKKVAYYMVYFQYDAETPANSTFGIARSDKAGYGGTFDRLVTKKLADVDGKFANTDWVNANKDINGSVYYEQKTGKIVVTIDQGKKAFSYTPSAEVLAKRTNANGVQYGVRTNAVGVSVDVEAYAVLSNTTDGFYTGMGNIGYLEDGTALSISGGNTNSYSRETISGNEAWYHFSANDYGYIDSGFLMGVTVKDPKVWEDKSGHTEEVNTGYCLIGYVNGEFNIGRYGKIYTKSDGKTLSAWESLTRTQGYNTKPFFTTLYAKDKESAEGEKSANYDVYVHQVYDDAAKTNTFDLYVGGMYRCTFVDSVAERVLPLDGTTYGWRSQSGAILGVTECELVKYPEWLDTTIYSDYSNLKAYPFVPGSNTEPKAQQAISYDPETGFFGSTNANGGTHIIMSNQSVDQVTSGTQTITYCADMKYMQYLDNHDSGIVFGANWSDPNYGNKGTYYVLLIGDQTGNSTTNKSLRLLKCATSNGFAEVKTAKDGSDPKITTKTKFTYVPGETIHFKIVVTYNLDAGTTAINAYVTTETKGQENVYTMTWTDTEKPEFKDTAQIGTVALTGTGIGVRTEAGSDRWANLKVYVSGDTGNGTVDGDGDDHWIECKCGTHINTEAHDKTGATARVEADCTTEGTRSSVTCPECNITVYQKDDGTWAVLGNENDLVIPATGHVKLTDINETPAGCESTGTKAHKKCECGVILLGGVVVDESALTIPATGHVKLTFVEKVEANCKLPGTAEHYKCECGKLFTDAEGENETTLDQLAIEIDPNNHAEDLVFHAASPSTCVKPGEIAYYQCVICGNFYSDAEGQNKLDDLGAELDPDNHANGLTFVEGKPADCDEAGYEAYYKCDDCGKLYSDANGENEITAATEIPATKHPNKYLINEKEPTLNDKGYTGDYYCPDCDTIVSTGTDIPVKTGAVASVDGYNYETFEEAVANADGKTVTLLSDVVLTSKLNVLGTQVWNLGDYTITSVAISDNYAIVVKGDLTINSGNFNIKPYYGIGVLGKLTINGGTFFALDDASYIIGNWGTTIINDGVFSGYYCCVNNFQGTTEINGGEYKVEGYEGEYDSATLLANAGLTVKGGIFSDNMSAFCVDGCTAYDEASGKYVYGAHKHVAGEVVEATCMAGGYTVYTCACGDTYNGDKTEKNADNHVIDLANTAWTKGEQTHYKECTCGARLEEKAHDGLNCTVCGNQTIGVYKSGDDLYFIEWNGKNLTGKFYVTTETGNEIVPEGWYYADETGKFIKEGFFNDKGTLRYIVNGQTVYTQVTKINGKLYMIDWDGKVLTGKFYITADSTNGLTTEGWHYTNADGSFIENGFYDDVDCRRYIVNGKTAYTRVTEIDGKFYMIDWDGEVKTGKFYITADSLNGYLNGEGWYYADENGNFYHDAFYTDGNVKRYILNGQAAYTRVTEINGDYYMIEWDGVVVISTDKFYITASSSKGQLKGAGWYKTDADGKIIVE